MVLDYFSRSYDEVISDDENGYSDRKSDSKWKKRLLKLRMKDEEQMITPEEQKEARNVYEAIKG